MHTWGEKKPFGAVSGQNGHCEMFEPKVHKESFCLLPDKMQLLRFRPYKLLTQWLSVHLFPPNNLYINARTN